MAHDSAQPCGCDPGAKWLCEDHRLIRDVVTETLADPSLQGPQSPYMAPTAQVEALFADEPRLPVNCQSCDGYVLSPEDYPYCPSCARERRLAELDKAVNVLLKAKNPDTRYMLRLKLKVTGDVSEHSFDSMTARNLFVFTLGPWADVQEEWTS